MTQAITLTDTVTLPRPPRSRDLGEPVRPICVGIEPADLAGLDALSLSQRVNRSALVRRAVKHLLATHSKHHSKHLNTRMGGGV